jgi:Protein of unknown function (DUF2946)
MRAWRSRRQFGAGLGLFALLLQLTLSFAHVHPEDLLGASAVSVVDEAAGKVLADRDSHVPGAPHDDCPICAVMHLARNIVLPDPPAFAVPTEFTVAAFSANDLVEIIVAPRRLPFQTRAPPVA